MVLDGRPDPARVRFSYNTDDDIAALVAGYGIYPSLGSAGTGEAVA